MTPQPQDALQDALNSAESLACLHHGVLEPSPPQTGEKLAGAAREWTRILGAGHVIQDAEARRHAETATFATHQTVPLILRPGNLEQVQECMRVAGRFRVPVYPVSSGLNWGYGSRVPVTGGCVQMNLGRMNRILDFSEELAYVTVEPGVTQRQLHEFLRSRGSRLWMDSSGASPESSLIGNTMERGFGHTPYGDHFAHACGLQVVLPDGNCIRTGFSRFAGAPAAPLYRWGLGPSLDGLFSQSNLGVVTSMSIWLMPAPEYFQAYFFRCDGDEDLADLIDALRPLRIDGTIRSAVHIGNDYKVLSSLRQYPWEETGGKTPLSPEIVTLLSRKMNFGRWNGSGALYGTRAQVAEARRLIRRALKHTAGRLQFLDERMLRIATRFSKPLGWLTGWDLGRTLDLLHPLFGLLQGAPAASTLASCYWRMKTPPPANPHPDRDGCGLLWCSPIAPIQGSHARNLMRIVNEVLLGHGFEPIVSITLLTERTICAVVSITYDRALPGEDERAMTCYRALVLRLTTQGYFPYRLGVQSMEPMNQPPEYAGLLNLLKNTLDPNGILSPGRYQPAGWLPAPANTDV